METEFEHPRLLITTDIGGDPDDQQSMIRLMAYANHFRIEGLIASASGTPNELRESVVKPHLIYEIIEGYAAVRERLARHEGGWPLADALHAVVKAGNPKRSRGDIGEGSDTEASRWIVECIDRGSVDDPLNIGIWGGQTDLAQALWRVRRERSEADWKAFVGKFRVYDINDQDGHLDWMWQAFAGMFYILCQAPEGEDKRRGTYRGMYLGGDETLTSREWIDANVRSKGPLGELYPTETWTEPNPHGCLKEGDTPSWFFFLPKGGNDPSDPTRPGWGGRFRKMENGLYRDLPMSDDFDPRMEVSRWRPAFQEDFARRMAWC